MIDPDIQKLEADLRALRPARPPAQTLERLTMALPHGVAGSRPLHRPHLSSQRWAMWRWFVPATCAMAILVLIMAGRNQTGRPNNISKPAVAAPSTALRADKIEIDRQLVADYEAIGRLPDGHPVRVRCEQWTDRVKVRDRAAGVVLERTIPRLEMVPVKFETY